MKYFIASFFALFLLGNSCVRAQFNHRKKDNDSQTFTFRKDRFISPSFFKSRAFQKAVAVPLLFTVAGLYSLSDNDLLNKFDVQEERNEWFSRFHYHADDYLQYAPIMAVYGLNLLGIKGKNDFSNRSAILLKSELMVGVLTFSFKGISKNSA